MKITLKSHLLRFATFIFPIMVIIFLSITYVSAQTTLSTVSPEDIITTQIHNKVIYDKYKHIPYTTTRDFSYTVHEYITPKGEKGYQTTYYYPDRIESIGQGVESTSRNYTIMLPINLSTSTPIK